MGNDVSALFDEANALDEQLQDFTQFRSRVIIRNDLARMGALLLGIGVVASFMNGIVVAGQHGPSLAAILTGWLSVSASSTLFTVLFRILALTAIIGIIGGLALSIYAPLSHRRRYRLVHQNFRERGWIACGAPTGFSVDDDNIWIKRPVPIIVWARRGSQHRSQWPRDIAALKNELNHPDHALMMRLLLDDRKFHGCITVRQLRSHYPKPKGGKGPSYLGFGPLHRMKARDDIAVIAPPSSDACQSPQPWQPMVFWIRR
ncbi:MAG: hypothetical protein Q4P71_04830 [Actinomycetaceae bacterium]|nr:hypothetical protein [Actinomycetaceae bacterium]